MHAFMYGMMHSHFNHTCEEPPGFLLLIPSIRITHEPHACSHLGTGASFRSPLPRGAASSLVKADLLPHMVELISSDEDPVMQVGVHSDCKREGEDDPVLQAGVHSF